MPDTPIVLATAAFLLAAVATAGLLHVYRWYRWITYGEPMP